jgi:hypothetical protein
MDEKIKSSISSLKEIVILLNGITLTFSITTLISKLRNPIDLVSSAETATLFLLFVLSVIRFYHGNMRLLDDLYITPANANPPNRNLALDFSAVLGVSTIFGAMGDFIGNCRMYFLCFLSILTIDILWAVICLQVDDIDTLKQQKAWTINNIVFVFIIILLIAVPHPYDVWARYLLIVGGFITTGVDFWWSWEFYFPRVRR